jgi:hypothetical protein
MPAIIHANATDLDKAFYIQSVKSAVSDFRRLSIYPVKWSTGVHHAKCIHIGAGFKAVWLATDAAGDGLFLVDEEETYAFTILAARDFSLHRYDLLADDGRRKAREYVRRKLLKL